MMKFAFRNILPLLVAGALLASQAGFAASPIKIVAAEAVYGSIATRVGGDHASVISLLTNPNQDPHEFEPSAKQAKELADADIVIENGAGYDAWIDKLLTASPSKTRRVLAVATLMHRTPGQNPHLWYNPRAIAGLSTALATNLAFADPANAALYSKNRDAVMNAMFPLLRKIGALRDHYRGMAIAATEPVFGEMAQAIGLSVLDERFALAIMNDSEPRASDIALFEDHLNQRAIAALIYNPQTLSPVVTRLRDLAQKNGIVQIAAAESMPAGSDYESWMMGILAQLEPALQNAAPKAATGT